MLSLFPNLYQYQLIAPLLLRLILGAVFIHWAFREMRTSSTKSTKKLIGIIEGIAGLLLIVGFWTQGAAIFTIIDLIIRTFERLQKRAFLTDGVNYYLILLVIAISILILGSGILAFDLPV